MQMEYELTNIQGIGESTKLKLKEAGITSIEQLATLTPEQLSQVKGFGPATSKKIIERVQEFSNHNGGNLQDCTLNKTSPCKPIVSYEDQSSKRYNKEILYKAELIQIRNFLMKRFKTLGYSILERQSNLLRRISKEIDFIAYKIVEVNPSVGFFVFFPIKISKLKGVLLVSDKNIVYQSTKKLVEESKECVVSAQQQIFRNITKFSALFQLIRQKLGNKTLSIQKTKDGTPLFIAVAQKQYKPVIYPVLVSFSEPAFLEKTTKFAYQRANNVHIIKYNAIVDLVQFLEKKEILREKFILENAVVQYRKSTATLKSNLQKYSIPVLVFGMIFGGMLFLNNLFLLATFTNLGIATLIIYGVILWFVYYTFQTSQKTLKAQFSTPRYLLPVEIDEIGILSIKDTLSSHELDQLIYEWFGKSCEFSCISNLEAEKTLEDQEHNRNESKSPLRTVKGHMISKYSSFLED